MRKLIGIAVTVMLIVSLALSVSAANSATAVTATAAVGTDEGCDVTLVVTIHLDTPAEALTFPVPANAASITLNGSRVGATQTNEARLVDLTKITGGMAGEFTFTITYRLKDVVDTNEEGFLQLQVPLLSGFVYPVQKLDFSVTLPGAVNAKPAFSSGYHQANIEQDLVSTVRDSMISGSSKKALNDRETLVMTLDVTDEMFPQRVIELHDFDLMYAFMGISAALALLYWFLFLRCAPPRRVSVSAPTEGFTAGQLGTILNMQGADLTMMVLSWAQLGYIMIKLDRKDRVILYKRMEMGSERSQFEQRCYKTLFGKRTQLDTTGAYYALQCKKVQLMPPNNFTLINPKSGSPLLFRGLTALIGLFGGVCLGMVLGLESAVMGFIIFLMALFGALSSWMIQPWADDLFLLRKRKLLFALLLCALWILLSAIADMLNLGIWVVVAQLIAGLMTSFGGRRTEAGRLAMAEALGLRRYLTRIPRAQLQHICKLNPEYFHSLVPHALALGVDKRFAKRFSRDIQPPCPWLLAENTERLTAAQWSKLLRRVVRSMDARRRQLVLERFFELFHGLKR